MTIHEAGLLCHTIHLLYDTISGPVLYFPYLSFSILLSRLSPFLALATPSGKPIAFAKAAASSYRRRASCIFSSSSANSPRLCVATAQPTSHSSVRLGGAIDAARVRAFDAHWRAWSVRIPGDGEGVLGKEEDVGGEDGDGGGFC